MRQDRSQDLQSVKSLCSRDFFFNFQFVWFFYISSPHTYLLHWFLVCVNEAPYQIDCSSIMMNFFGGCLEYLPAQNGQNKLLNI